MTLRLFHSAFTASIIIGRGDSSISIPIIDIENVAMFIVHRSFAHSDKSPQRMRKKNYLA